MKPPRVKICLIISTCLWLWAALLGAFISIFVLAFAFDAPGSDQNPVILAYVRTIIAFPVVCVVAVLLSWLFYWFRLSKTACAAALLPFGNIILFCVLLALDKDRQNGYEKIEGAWAYIDYSHGKGIVTAP